MRFRADNAAVVVGELVSKDNGGITAAPARTATSEEIADVVSSVVSEPLGALPPLLLLPVPPARSSGDTLRAGVGTFAGWWDGWG